MRDRAARELRDFLNRFRDDRDVLLALLLMVPAEAGRLAPFLRNIGRHGFPTSPKSLGGLLGEAHERAASPLAERVRQLAYQVRNATREKLIADFCDDLAREGLSFGGARRIPQSLEELLSQRLRGEASTEMIGPPLELERLERREILAPERLVQSGFASPGSPSQPFHPMTPLLPGVSYFFWLEIGPPIAGAIDTAPVSLPDDLPTGARIEVALYGFPEEMAIEPGADVGVLRLRKDGTVEVERQPAMVEALPGLLTRRLLFPVRTPARPGVARLRCNLYCKQVLISSLMVEAVVASLTSDAPSLTLDGARRLRSYPDYALSRSLSPVRLNQIGEHRLSVMINKGSEGTHDFRFFGADGEERFKREIDIDELPLQDQIRLSREALRMAAWGDAGEWKLEWDPEARYRYARPRERRELAADIARLAYAGYRLYLLLVRKLAAKQDRDALERILLSSGRVQVALRESPSFVLPAAILYDIPVDSNAFPVATTEHRLCEAFEAALTGSAPLEECVCFHGGCPQRKRATEAQADPDRLVSDAGPVICPSGFWGFRHAIGLPVSVGEGPDAPPHISFEGSPRVAVGVSTDPKLHLRAAHEAALQGLRADLSWERGATRAEVLKMLKSTRAQLIYFYCHGGVTKSRVPYLEVGYQESGITPDNLESNGIAWRSPRPLVFINGCHTTALEPEVAIDMVSAFVEDAAAAGVIGTEITVFEPLARDFAEACLRRFLNGTDIGEAVRGARLELLRQGNPLGLAYIPFALSSLDLVES